MGVLSAATAFVIGLNILISFGSTRFDMWSTQIDKHFPSQEKLWVVHLGDPLFRAEECPLESKIVLDAMEDNSDRHT